MLKEFDEKYMVDEVLSGNRKALVQLIEQYQGLVLHIVTPLIGTNEDREDICQDVFIKIFEKLNTFQFKSKLGTWIGNIAYNTSLNFLRKKRNILLSSLVPPESELSFIENAIAEFDTPEQILIRREDMSQLSKSIDKLSSFQRTILLLFYKEQLNLEEISEIMEMPVNTVKSHLFRAKNSLKQFLNHHR